MKTRSFLVGALMLGAVGQALAVRVTNATAPSPDTVRRGAVAASQADDSTSLREGVITAVNDKRDQVLINGSWLKVVEGKTRVFRQGRSVKSGDELVNGKQVKFTLMPGGTDPATLGVVYVP